MAIIIKSPEEIQKIYVSSQIAGKVLKFIEPHVTAGTTTNELNDLCHNFILEQDAIPSPLNYRGFPKSICTSVNQVICHGIPNETPLKTGDILKIDVATLFNGFHGDTCKTFQVGKTSRAARDLVQCTQEALFKGIEAVKIGATFGDIGHAIQSFAEAKGYSIVREFCGHGIGKNFHEDPYVTHYGKKGSGPKIKEGMVFTIEPMLNQGKKEIVTLDDNWTVETKDKKLSAQFEHTIAVTKDGVRILSLIEE